MTLGPGPRRDLVLIGGGHSHVQVLRRYAMEPVESARLTVVLDTPIAVYSGMVPGFVAGQYSARDLEIDVLPLARRAGARVLLAAAVGVDTDAGRIVLDGRPSIPYDVASFDIGSAVAGSQVPGVKEHALPTRPIGLFVRRIGEALAALTGREHEGVRTVVVGGGVGGVELAFTLRERLLLEGVVSPKITLLEAGPRILPGSAESLARRVHRCAHERAIEIRCGSRVVGVRSGEVAISEREVVPFDLLAWVTGAVGHALFRQSGLPTDERGFVLVGPTLQVHGHDNLFAAGDCATLAEYPETPKAGVYAVRQGPYLTDNLRAFLSGGRLREYEPQGDFLALLNLGDGSALASKWGVAFEGRPVMRLKDWIDRRFTRRFQVLDESGASTAECPPMNDGMEMLCGGCAAKVGQSVLQGALSRIGDDDSAPLGDGSDILLGLASSDDAAAVRTPHGDVLATTVDAFSSFVDDPWTVGRAAAVNAASDLWATGVEPRHALALVAVPEDSGSAEAEELLYQVLAGARRAFGELGVNLLGGHTTTAAKLMVGFSIDGFAPDATTLLRLDQLKAGQRLLLTKPLGTGVLFHADMQGLARGPWLEAALRSVLEPNLTGFLVLRALGVRAATDVTGFGLVGHLGEMLRSSGMSATIELERVPSLPGALELLRRGLRSTFHAENERARRDIVVSPEHATDVRLQLLFDPQTSGGLLFGLGPNEEQAALERLEGAAVIGAVGPPRADGALIEVV